MVWESLCDRYLDPEEQLFVFDRWPALWKRVDEGDIILRPWEHTVLRFTFDNALVRREDFDILAAALEMFQEAHQKSGSACHLRVWAQEIRELVDGEMAVGLHATSVNANPWYDYDEESEEYTPYNVNTGDRHWFIDAAQAHAVHAVVAFLRWGASSDSQWSEYQAYQGVT